jgi:hypothetical protein
MCIRNIVVVIVLSLFHWMGWLAPQPIAAQTPYPRAGFITKLSTLAHGVSGYAQIVDARTIRLTQFNYDGGGPQVYAYLGTSNTNAAFENGSIIGEQLNGKGPYANATLTLTLPITAPNLDGFTAISIWCADFRVNFGSGAFVGQLFLPVLTK